MISLVRIDDRLIHGQVAVVWTKHLGVNRILVANDQIVNNEVQKMSLRMAAPDTVKCGIMAVKEAGEVLNDPRSEKRKSWLSSTMLRMPAALWNRFPLSKP